MVDADSTSRPSSVTTCGLTLTPLPWAATSAPVPATAAAATTTRTATRPVDTTPPPVSLTILVGHVSCADKELSHAGAGRWLRPLVPKSLLSGDVPAGVDADPLAQLKRDGFVGDLAAAELPDDEVGLDRAGVGLGPQFPDHVRHREGVLAGTTALLDGRRQHQRQAVHVRQVAFETVEELHVAVPTLVLQRRHGVKHDVRLSVDEFDRPRTVPHGRVEADVADAVLGVGDHVVQFVADSVLVPQRWHVHRRALGHERPHERLDLGAGGGLDDDHRPGGHPAAAPGSGLELPVEFGGTRRESI